jgi:uncharacterized protein (DUF2267 family)
VVTRIGSQTHSGAAEYDIHVLAFPAASQRTVQGLRELFGLDAHSAQRIIASVPTILRQRVPAAEAEACAAALPTILRQRVPAAEAEACAAALRKLGARVVLEPPQVREPPPPPAAAYLQHTANWPDANRSANDGLPRPVARNPGADLEYDVLNALEAALDGDPPAGDVPGLRKLTPRVSVEQLEEPMPMLEDEPSTSMGKGRQEELDLEGGGGRDQIALELDGATQNQQNRRPAAIAQRRPAEPQAAERDAASGTTQPRQPLAQTGTHTRAALVERRAPEQTPSRNLPLLQLLAACGVFAVGYWLNSSVLYGSAGWVSIVRHGLGLQQLILGLRGLFA